MDVSSPQFNTLAATNLGIVSEMKKYKRASKENKRYEKNKNAHPVMQVQLCTLAKLS